MCALVFTWATNPGARISLLRWLRDSYEIARSYPWDSGPIRTAGKDLRSIDLPWWYVPSWLGAQLPLLMIAAVVAGSRSSVRTSFGRELAHSSPAFPSARSTAPW